LMLYTLAIFCV